MLERDHFEVPKRRLQFRIGTQSHWVTGATTTVHRRLIDVLNAEHTEAFLAEDVSVRGRLHTHYRAGRVEYANINVSQILLAVPVDEVRDAVPARDPLTWVKKRPERVLVGIGAYEIVGDIFLGEEYKLRDVLTAVRERFMAIAKATITRIDDPSFNEEHDVVFVNREWASLVMPAPTGT